MSLNYRGALISRLFVSLWLSLGVCSAAAAGSIFVDAGRGPVEVHTPASYDPLIPTPVVMLLHGYTSSGPGQEAYMQFSPLAESFGFIYLYPTGTTDLGGAPFWNATNACCDLFGSGVDDSGYLRDLLDEVQAELNVDASRIHLIGHSNGGFMSYRMACDHPDIIASIASLAGATFTDPASCSPASPVHVLQIHGTSDGVIAYGGGQIFGESYPGALGSVEQWAGFDGCTLDFDDTFPPLDLDASIAGDETLVRRYESGCASSGSTELWTIVGGGHGPVLSAEFSLQVVEYLYAHPKAAALGAVFQRGDVNQDGSLNVADPVSALAHLFDGAALDCLAALDANDDGQTDISDPVFMLDYLFSGGTEPTEPFPGCGVDPAPDGLDCATSSCL